MKKLIFETATLADAAQRAARVAPVKGTPFDRAAGVVITASPDSSDSVIVASTDLTVTFRTQITTVEQEGIDEPVSWRLPAQLFAGIVSALPMGSGSTVEIRSTDKDHHIFILSGKSKAKIAPLSMATYPLVEEFDSRDMSPVSSLASRLSQISWACGTNETALSGIHIDGTNIYACDKARLAWVPCDMPIASPVTAPLAGLSALLRNATDIHVRATATRLEIQQDAYTQMSGLLYADPYPDLKPLLTLDTFTGAASIPVAETIDCMNRMMVLVRGERLARLKIAFTENVLKLDMEVDDVGRMVDEIEIQTIGNRDHSTEMTPTDLVNALTGSGRPRVTVEWGPHSLSPLKFSDDNGFKSLVTVRAPAAGSAP